VRGLRGGGSGGGEHRPPRDRSSFRSRLGLTFRVWGFAIVTAIWLILAACGAGTLGLILLPLCCWTFVLYVRCTREAIRNRHEKKD
jgi:hypothetical protein